MDVTLNDVYHSLSGKLFCASKMGDLRYNVLLDRVGCKILKGQEAVLVVERSDGPCDSDKAAGSVRAPPTIFHYLQNRLPTSPVEKTPYELWHGKKPSHAHLRTFGSEGGSRPCAQGETAETGQKGYEDVRCRIHGGV